MKKGISLQICGINPIQWIVIFLLVYAPFVEAGEYRLQFVPSLGQTIEGLAWDESPETQAPVIQVRAALQSGPQKGAFKSLAPYYVKLRGKFVKESSNLLLNSSTTIFLKADHSFEIEVPIEGEVTQFVMAAVSPTGEVIPQTDQLLFPKWGDWIESQKSASPKKWSMSPGLGFTLATYQQTGAATLNETLLTFKASGEYRIGSVWDIGGSVYASMLPITSNQSGTSVRFLGLNARAGFRLKQIPDPWELVILGGYYYTTTFSSGASLGYHHFQGPQIYPVVKRKFSHGRVAWVFFKFSPIFDGESFLGLKNAEYAVGGGYSFLAFKKHVLAATVDVAILGLQASDGSSIQCNTYTLGLSYRF